MLDTTDWLNKRSYTLATTIWTEERFRFAADLGGQGYTAGYIATALTRQFNVVFSRNAVIGKLHRTHTPFGKPREAAEANKNASKPKTTAVGVTDQSRRKRIARIKAEAIVPVELPAEPPKKKEFLGLTLFELTEESCRFPRGDGPFLFCGQPRQQGSAYCQVCHPLCYDKPSTLKSWRGAQLRNMGREYKATLRDAPP